MEAGELESGISAILHRHQSERRQLLAILRDVQERWRHLPAGSIRLIAEALDLPIVQVEGTATFYHFLSDTHRGKYTIYVNTSTTAEMAGLAKIIHAFEKEIGVSVGQTTADQQMGLFQTSCIGMSDQEPAALINDVVFTFLTPAKVKRLVHGMKAGLPVKDLVGTLGDGNNALPEIHSEVKNHIRLKGPVFFAPFTPGSALRKAIQTDSLDIIEMIKRSGLRGRGGAGFSTGQKWGICRSATAESRYVFCNVDEGEPGTFKDRVLMTELPHLIFEGMVVAGYAIESKRGIVYLRAEYAYLRNHLEKVLEEMRQKNFLGRKILGTRFSFDIKIKMGAGAYICGEESALIESAEGKRGEPRNRPPFPVIAGYRHRPTIVNNAETFGCAARIVLQGDEWFKGLGTPASSGTKLLSIAGDCNKPGIYEVEWGKTINEVLSLCEAQDVFAVQVGGPSGVCIGENQFHRRLCFSDLPTGGALTIYNKKRDLLSIVHNHMEFFARESCGFCVPCRAGNGLLVKTLEKIRIGNGTSADLESIQSLGKMVKSASRCGLGQSSPNPLLSTIENFPELYLQKTKKSTDYISQFDMEFATVDAASAARREPFRKNRKPEK